MSADLAGAQAATATIPLTDLVDPTAQRTAMAHELVGFERLTVRLLA